MKDKKGETEISGKSLASGEIVFHMQYTDALGTSYDSEQREVIFVQNIPWYYSIWLSLLSFFE